MRGALWPWAVAVGALCGCGVGSAGDLRVVDSKGGGCAPACSGKACGDDGCGGTCGSCTGLAVCSSAGACIAPVCTPACAGKTCGDDGCGGACGTCGGAQVCLSSGTCVSPATGTVAVDAGAGQRPIHPEIYGLAFATTAQLQETGATLNRQGGNGTSLYNWQLDVHNTGFDWYWENIPDGDGTPSGSVDALVRSSFAAGAQALITIPTIGWTPKGPRVTSHPFVCSFPASVFANQDSFDPWDSNCGNGQRGGADLATETSYAYTASTPSFQAQWVAHLTSTFGTAAQGGVRFYQLDNEVNLWSSTHRDAHPSPTTYDEIWSTTVDYASAIKQVDPDAKVLGYGTWSALDVFYSALDTASGSSDQAQHGGVPLARWYLQQLAAHDAAHGGRLIDCLDLHYYPQGGDPLENTRSLWDATYTDPSWMDDVLGEPIRLFPRLSEWIAQDYPGMDVCVSEYNFELNNGTDPRSALVQADVLGIYGKYGVRLAAFWTVPYSSSGAAEYPLQAFALYRNYDGAGGKFGDVAVSAASTITGVSVFAATRSTDGALTVVLLNKGTTARTAPVTLAGFSAGATGEVWQFVTTGTGITARPGVAVASGQVTLALPAQSMTMLVVPKG